MNKTAEPEKPKQSREIFNKKNVMYLNYFKQNANLSSKGAMETGNHSKNGASPKSQTSRRNILSWGIPLLLSVCAVFSSCSKDDDESGNDNHLLIGKWEAVNEDILKDDGSWELDYTYEPEEYIWLFDETHLLIQNEDWTSEASYSYHASKKELTITHPIEGIYTLYVLKLTQNELEVEQVDKDETIKIVFKKIP
jgi:hypothetical protein